MIKIINIVLLSLCLLQAPVFASAETKEQAKDMYFIEVIYESGNVSIGEIIKNDGYPHPNDTAGINTPVYRIDIVSFSGQVLETDQFGFILADSGTVTTDEQGMETSVLENKAKDVLVIPYHEDGGYVKIYTADNQEVSVKKLGELAQVCGDGICQEHEYFALCPLDCQEEPVAAAEPVVNKEIEAAAPRVPDALAESAVNPAPANRGFNDSRLIIFSVIGFLVLLLIVLVVYQFVIKKKEIPAELWDEKKNE